MAVANTGVVPATDVEIDDGFDSGVDFGAPGDSAAALSAAAFAGLSAAALSAAALAAAAWDAAALSVAALAAAAWDAAAWAAAALSAAAFAAAAEAGVETVAGFCGETTTAGFGAATDLGAGVATTGFGAVGGADVGGGGGETSFPVAAFTTAPEGVVTLPDVMGTAGDETATVGAGDAAGTGRGVKPTADARAFASCGVVVKMSLPFWKI